MGFVSSLGAYEIDSVCSSVSSRLRRRQPSLSFPVFVADRRSGYVLVLVWYRLEISGLILDICSFCISGCPSSDFFWGGLIRDGGVGRRRGCLLPVN